MTMKHTIPILILATVLAGGVGFVYAQANTAAQNPVVQDPALAAEISDLQRTVADQKAQADTLSEQVSAYKQQINEKEREAKTLENALDSLETRIASTNLDIRATQASVNATNTELKIIDARLEDVTHRLATQRELMGTLLRKIDTADAGMNMQALFTADSFAEFFDRLESLQNVSGDLLGALNRAKLAKDQLAYQHTQQQASHDQLAALADTLADAHERLADETGTKTKLLAETRSSESRFQSLLANVRRDQADVANKIASLQNEIDRKLKQRHAVGGHSFIWPASTSYRGISTLFHDPTYPFRHLFEHTGLDIPQRQGTPIHAAAAGYVSRVYKGADYGYYVMIIHENSLATLYAHLSRIDVTLDQYVEQGQTIGLSGGMPGTLGAGFSTGPHLHFEIRKNGIPVNPLDYLPPRE